MPNYPMYPQNYPQFPTYPQYQQFPQYQQPQMNSFQNGTSSQPMQQPMPQPQPAPVQPPIQSSPPVNVRSEQEARDWPIAPGNSVTFINDNAGYVYTKTSLNQFDRPQFVKYRLVKEEDVEAVHPTPQAPASYQAAPPGPAYALQSDLDALSGDVAAIRADIDAINAKKQDRAKKEEKNEEGEG